jgi:hypothetical protein
MDFSTNILEEIRGHHQQIELLEEAVCQALAYKQKFPKEQVVCDMLISKIVNRIKTTASFLSDVYTNQKSVNATKVVSLRNVCQGLESVSNLKESKKEQ